jgi:Polyketide cyclase / dehydrase and lipid transport
MAPRNQRWWLTHDSEELVIKASPELLYQMVADLCRMGEWSPECQAVEWEAGVTGPAEGARFLGHNRGGPGGLMRWSRRGRVLTADAGREFTFATEEGGHESTVWCYRFEPDADGTRVTESYDVKRIPAWARILDVPTNRHRELLEGMRHTLQQLKNAAEAMSSANDQL